ncbi:MAG: Fpg/Nei family DNA glycosylase [Candidatus Eremiobacteraeota bacterium]|nr:Fpg/Nei family DNA glycosylase [Candidatus Eremiobacteraeota bacterium]MBV8366057.1 Fpg/Nei family DNA glycosylase [Candidatus Eremiobacteraeota bacterium]
MPELPELELLREQLGKHAGGAKIINVVLDPKRAFIIRYPPMDFARELTGKRIAGVGRRGKFLMVSFADFDKQLIVNPMLGGRFAIASRAAPALASTCFTLQLEKALDVRFLDSTQMARIYLTATPETDVPAFAQLGPDALDPALTYDVFAARLRKHRGELKNVLRNQAFVSGIGNAYADEILFAARLRPLRRAGTLDDRERHALYDAMRATLREAIEITGAQYAAGKHPLHKQERSFMKIHGRKKTTCPRCGHRISVVHPGGEATYYCRGCQL